MQEYEDSKTRFSQRVTAYAKYRPGYPDAAVEYVVAASRSERPPIVADVGSGTGIFCRLLLERGCRVYGVEPNKDMRDWAARDLAGFELFTSVDGEGKATGVPEESVNLITAAQSFHWFAIPDTVGEFSRILAPGGCVALIWNSRRTDGDDFHAGYEALLKRWCPEYQLATHKSHSPQSITDLFSGWIMEVAVFPNCQEFDLISLRGRVESSSYCPLPDDPSYTGLTGDLGTLFRRCQSGGVIQFSYETEVFLLRP